MAEYIDREKLIAEIIAEADKEGKKSYDMAERGCDDLSVKYTHGEYCYSVAAHIVETAPAADVVEVVRCKDCKFHREAHYEDEEEPPYIKHICKLYKRTMQLDDYCSYGEI